MESDSFCYGDLGIQSPCRCMAGNLFFQLVNHKPIKTSVACFSMMNRMRLNKWASELDKLLQTIFWIGHPFKTSFGAYGDNGLTLTAFCLGRIWADNNGYPVSLKIHGQQFWEGVFQADHLVFACHHVISGSYGVPFHVNLSQNWTRIGYHTFYLGQRSDELEESSSVVCML